MIAGSEHVNAHFQQFLGDGRCDAETAGGIFPICDCQVDAVRLDDILQVVGNNAPPGRSEDISHE